MSWLDSAIRFVSPRWAAERSAWRQYEQWAAAGYRSATSSRLANATPVGAMADYHLEQGYDRERMVDRAMQLARDNAMARGLLERNAENVVGCGIRPQAKTADAEWNRLAEARFDRWADEEADVRGMSTFWDLQRLAQLSLARDGDVGLVKVQTGEVQLIEAPRIAAPIGKEFSPSHIDGIDLDAFGRPLTFHIVPRRPDEAYTASTRDLPSRVTVPADQFLFLARRSSPGQTRGEPALAQAMELFEHIDRLLEAVVTSARMAACFGILIEAPLPLPLQATTTNAAGQTAKKWNLEPAMVKTLKPGEKVSTLSPSQPTQSLDAFVSLMARVVGLPLGMPLELLMLDFSQTNYSSARASLLQAQRSFKQQQQYLIQRLCRPIWRWKIRQWIEDGELPANDEAERHDWIAPGWPWVDPVKEAQAAQMAIDGGFSTLREVVTGMGKDFDSLLTARKAELDALEAAGIDVVRSTMTRDPLANVMAAQASPATADDESDDDEDEAEEMDDE